MNTAATSKLARRLSFYSAILAIVVGIGLTAYNQAQKGLWKAEIRRLNEHLAYYEARIDFVKGRARLLRISGQNSDVKFTGEYEGPFEIWLAVFNPSMGEMYTYSEQQYVYYYNLYMRNFRLHGKEPTTENERNQTPVSRDALPRKL